MAGHLYSRTTLARIAGISPNTLQRRIDTGDIAPVSQLGRFPLFDEATAVRLYREHHERVRVELEDARAALGTLIAEPVAALEPVQ